jgi:hypothetical protein
MSATATRRQIRRAFGPQALATLNNQGEALRDLHERMDNLAEGYDELFAVIRRQGIRLQALADLNDLRDSGPWYRRLWRLLRG